MHEVRTLHSNRLRHGPHEGGTQSVHRPGPGAGPRLLPLRRQVSAGVSSRSRLPQASADGFQSLREVWARQGDCPVSQVLCAGGRCSIALLIVHGGLGRSSFVPLLCPLPLCRLRWSKTTSYFLRSNHLKNQHSCVFTATRLSSAITARLVDE